MKQPASKATETPVQSLAKTPDQIADAIRAAARAAPTRKREHEHSMRAIVMRVAAELEEMREKGYNLPEITKLLNDQGLEIARPTLATYLRSYRLEQVAKTTLAGQTSAATAPPAKRAGRKSAPG